MNIKPFSFTVMLLLVLLSACGGPAPAGSSTPTATIPAATPAVTPLETGAPLPFPADTALLVWHREGGIAGFCDDLTVYADGSFTVTNCMALPGGERTGQLTAEQLRQLDDWVNTFKSFSTSEGEDATYPDAMILKTAFTGAGTAQPGTEDLAAINNFASLLVVRPASGGDGGQPQALMKAREFLAAELNLSVEAVSLVSFEFLQWPDRCLGVVIKGQLCAQGVTPGYKVVLEAQGQLYELHTDESGESIRQAP